MIALIFATLREARPFLGLSRAEIREVQPFAVYHTALRPRLRIAVSGMGKVAAAAACQALILTHQAGQVINAGACGSLNDLPGMSVGQLLRITTVQEGDHEVFGKRPLPVACAARLAADLPPARLVTCDRPIFDRGRRAACAKLGDVVDMEGAAIARVADLYRVPCEMIKGISDNAGPMDRKTLLQNLDRVSGLIAAYLWQNMDGFIRDSGKR
jgi:nucleoside phosphorylase